jgi:hypothetical protein
MGGGRSACGSKALRDTCPRGAHAVWKAPKDRRDTVATVLAAEKRRFPDLLPLRHGRMVRSPFTLYRGSPLAMAADQNEKDHAALDPAVEKEP